LGGEMWRKDAEAIGKLYLPHVLKPIEAIGAIGKLYPSHVLKPIEAIEAIGKAISFPCSKTY